MSAGKLRSASVLVTLCTLFAAGGAGAKPTTADLRRLLAIGAELQVGVTRTYDSRYQKLPYPGGDVAPVTGVCADVVVRSFRRIGIDLQVELHEDMKRNFRVYPHLWGLREPDPSIDHRRVPNLMTYFKRKGKALPPGSPYLPGDIVAWKFGWRRYHIGVVSSYRTPDGRPMVVHNIGRGALIDDVLGRFPRIGHYRW